MVIAAVLLLAPWFIPTEEGSVWNSMERIVADAGLRVWCYAEYSRP